MWSLSITNRICGEEFFPEKDHRPTKSSMLTAKNAKAAKKNFQFLIFNSISCPAAQLPC
jgi:hypothetical protein